MHVRRCQSDISQGRCLVRSNKVIAGSGKSQLGTICTRVIAKATQAIERIGPGFTHRCDASHRWQFAARRQYRRVVELVVREQRPIVAVDTLCIANKKAQPCCLIVAQNRVELPFVIR